MEFRFSQRPRKLNDSTNPSTQETEADNNDLALPMFMNQPLLLANRYQLVSLFVCFVILQQSFVPSLILNSTS